MQLTTFETDTQTVKAGYVCPCGCTPSVTYERGGELARSHCCCGNEFVVGLGAERTLEPREGFVLETESRTTGWGEAITAAWLVGPSVHPEPAVSHDHHTRGHGDADGSADAAIDPVCGMRVARDGAVEKGLHHQHAGIDYYFCARGCYLDFGDDPERFLDPSYIPSM
jgi:YHS domain-containing protein